MEYTKEIFVKDYFDIHNFYSKIYGLNRTIILMQVGSFHESYCTDTDGLDLVSLASKLDVVCTRKNSKDPVSKGNPRMLGFPIHVTDNFIEKLCNLNYTVIKIDQTSEPPKPKREIVGIISPGTINKQINYSSSSYIVSMVIDKIKGNNLCIGIASYDLSTGHGSYYEAYSKQNDFMIVLDDIIRYLDTCPPKEVILYNSFSDDEKINNFKIDDIVNYLNIDQNILFNYNNAKNSSKLSYQKIIFEKVFPNNSTIFEKLNLHLYNWARFALTNLYEYVEHHQNNLIQKLNLPLQFENNKFLYLGNHSLEQLNVFNKNPSDKSLFQIINNTKTSLGKRFLNDALCKPLLDKDILAERYELISNIISNNYSEKLVSLLEDISDIDRLIRRLDLGTMNPSDLYLLYLSLYQIDKLTIFCNSNNIFNIDYSFNTKSILEYFTNTFNIDMITSLNFNNLSEYDKNIFKPNIYPDYDLLIEELQSSTCFMDNLVSKLSSLIDDKKTFVKNNEDYNMITVKYNEREGHYLFLTSRRCDILKKKLEGLKEISIGKYKLQISDLEFEKLPKSSSTKIKCTKIKEVSNELIIIKSKIAKLMKEKFKLQLSFIANNYNNLFSYWAKKIGLIDFINSGAITAIKNHYSKPILEPNDVSFFSGTDIRHPIVEYISKDYEYKPQHLHLGSNELSGILLYGINSSGKSTLMKSIGLNIILAQIGYYTATSKFVYSPYQTLFTRINGNDNLYKGLSSFMVEMIELTSILKRNNSNTIVLADEICRGTEEKSANIIVAHMLEKLSSSNTTFITATHLHKVANLPSVKKIKNLKAMHLKITYDDVNDQLIYDRELSEGQGDTFYGLTVAKYLMKDHQFNESTSKILLEYDDYSEVKKSKYNSDNFLIECEICKSKNNLETHHIVFQKDFEKKITKLHYQKDANYNLVTLCMSCHDDVDRSKIVINGWKETSNGRLLDYETNNKIIKKSKYSDELVEYIKSLKNNGDVKMARIKIKETYDKKLSSQTILSFWG
uniref:DNA mismatch repair proteins mutS family domain-containing protein n=1 Tax=viral metagenome TaxID=1070528 RepID=A0A6C0DAV0_9ZZZZ